MKATCKNILDNVLPHHKISIITVSYNAATVIEKTILSVINQTYPYKEYIIIDGGSTDGTIDIIKKYQDKITYWISEPDKGIYDAMNKGILLTTGDYINFMNAGDSFYDKDTLDKVASYMAQKDDEIIYGDINYIYDRGNKITHPHPLELLATKNLIFSHQASFASSTLMKQCLFDTKYKISSDYNFFYQQYNSKKSFKYIPVCIANFDCISGVSTKQILKALKEDAIINGNIKKISWHLSYYITCFNVRIRTFVASILPRKLVLRIKKYKNNR